MTADPLDLILLRHGIYSICCPDLTAELRAAAHAPIAAAIYNWDSGGNPIDVLNQICDALDGAA